MPAVDFFVPFAVAHSKDAFLSSSARIFGQKELIARSEHEALSLVTDLCAMCMCPHTQLVFCISIDNYLTFFFSILHIDMLRTCFDTIRLESVGIFRLRFSTFG